MGVHFYQAHPLIHDSCWHAVQVPFEELDTLMRDLVFERWRADACEAVEDTLKMISLVDLYVPYFPLRALDLRELIVRGLQQRAAELQKQKHVAMSWDTDVVDFLLSKVGGGKCCTKGINMYWWQQWQLGYLWPFTAL